MKLELCFASDPDVMSTYKNSRMAEIGRRMSVQTVTAKAIVFQILT